MKAKSFLLKVVLFLSFVSLIGCDGGGGGPTSPSFTPNAGIWSGSNIKFLVSSDGSKITIQGSSLEKGSSLILYIWYSGDCSGTGTIWVTRDIPINNLSFEYKSDTLEVKGQFSSSTSASGTYSFSYTGSELCAGTISGSGNWSASTGG